VKEEPSKDARLAKLRELLEKCDFPESFQLPINPNVYCSGVIPYKCRVMESKKKPLWLTFKRADERKGTMTFMFKAGDDLRQDQLTLQV
jgi:phosphatidylinositol kinase/protein kinase (PI-3  family)